jgi:hypothetical protein
MKQASAIAVGLLLFGLTGLSPDPGVLAQSAAGWTTLLDGSNMDAFTPLGDANWRVEDGAVQADGGSGFLVSKSAYGDFELRVEFWASPDANSGIFIRCQNPQAVSDSTCYEVNIYDQRPDPMYRTGGIVDVAKPMAMVNAGNQWNTYEITAKGPQLMVRLNGTPTVNIEDRRLARGPFALQYSMGTLKFRNVQIR